MIPSRKIIDKNVVIMRNSKKLKYKNWLCVSLLSLLVFCRVYPLSQGELPEVKVTITLTEMLSIGNLDDDLIFMWADVFVDEAEIIYLTDLMDYSLKKFDRDGQLLKKTGRKGQGPGEFQAPLGLSGSGNFLYVRDQYLLGIQVFDRDLNFVKRIPYKQIISEFKALSDECLAVVPMSLKGAGALFLIDCKGDPIRQILYRQEKNPQVLQNQVSFDMDREGNVYLAYNFRDKIDKIGPQGKIIWSRKLLDVKEVKKKTIQKFTVPTAIIYKSVVVDSHGNLMILGGEFSKHNSRDVYVLNSRGEYLTTFTLPDTSHCLYLDSRNYLYSRANSGVTLKKYKLNYKWE